PTNPTFGINVQTKSERRESWGFSRNPAAAETVPLVICCRYTPIRSPLSPSLLLPNHCHGLEHARDYSRASAVMRTQLPPQGYSSYPCSHPSSLCYPCHCKQQKGGTLWQP